MATSTAEPLDAAPPEGSSVPTEDTSTAGAPAPRPTRRAVETLIGTVVWTMIWALLLNTCLQVMHTGGVKILIVTNLYQHFPVFALCAAVIWLVVLFVLALTNRLWLTCAITLDLVVALGMIDRAKLQVRKEPVYPSDLDFLSSPKFLFSMVTPGRLLLGLVALLAIAAVVLLVGRAPRRTFRPIHRSATPRIWTGVTVTRVVIVLVGAFMFHYAAGFNTHDNKLRQAFEGAGADWAFWYQDVNYSKNGVVAGLLYNLLSEPMKQPADYSRATMAEIATRWQGEADRINAARSGDLGDVNVVSVLSEAFSDPTRVKGTHLDGDPIPFTRDLMTRTTSGTMLAQLYGGGTANMEFETLTGQSLSEFEPQVNTPYQQFVNRQSSYPSIVGYLEGHGHRAIAVHPYMTAMYQRTKVYKAFGIENFIHDTTMHEKTKIDDNNFISDSSAFDEVARQLRDTSDPLLVNLVTMQNHFPMESKYDNPWSVSGVSGRSKKELAGYSRGINYSDKALATFLGTLTHSPEKTAVIFYGDHLPGIYTSDIYDQNGDVGMKSTPFFIWTNFATPKLDTAKLTSPIYFMPLLFEQLGAKVPPYYALLTEMYKRVPAMEQGIRFDWSGDEVATPDAETAQLLHDYRLIQYDLSVGKRYSQDAIFHQQ